MSSSPRIAIAVAVAFAASATFARADVTRSRETMTAPVIASLDGGLTMSNFHLSSSILAYPLQSPPVNGFAAQVAVTLTDQQSDDDTSFYAVKQTSIIGNALPQSSPGTPYTYLATLDSGGQSHILSYADATRADIANSNRAGAYSVDVEGANGTEPLDISDALGVFVTGANNVSVSGGTIHAPAASFTGEIHTSILTAEAGSTLPSIVGGPMLAFYAVNIKNSQTRRIVQPDGKVVRTPNVEFVNHGAGQQYKYKLALNLQDPLGANGTDPALFPSFDNFENFADNPSTPTFWTFPFANVNLQHTGGSLQQQPFLFDTGAQVTVLSEETADAIGFDNETDTPDFTVQVDGVGGTSFANGFFVQKLELPVTGGTAIFYDVPVVVLDVIDPRDGSGNIPGIIGTNLFTDRDLSLDMNRTGQSYVRFTDALTPQWNQNASGTWLPDANWDLGVPDGSDLPANFLGAITAARTITVDGNYTIGSMKFDNANSYTLSGTGTLSFSTTGRPSKIEVLQGSHTVSSPLLFGNAESPRMSISIAAASTLTLSGETASPLVDVTKLGTGQLRLKDARYKSLSITAGSVQLLASTAVDTSLVNTLTISPGGSLDLTNRKLIIDYDTVSPLQDVRTNLAAGRMLSTLATSNKAIGYGEASALHLTTFGGTSFVGNAVLLRLTLKGDTDLNGTVDFSDLLALAQNYGKTTGTVWTTGDFDYNGATNFDDLLAIAQNYGGTYALADLPAGVGGADFAADWALAQSLVPEPTTLLGLIAMVPLRRARRR